MKAYTDLSQSKKLAEILPLDSADMGWNVFVDDTTRILPINDWDCVKDGSGNVKFYHAWSLSALLRVIPKHIKDYNVLRIDISDKDFAIWYDEIGYGVNNELPNITEESAVDACVNMILKLKKIK